MRAAGFSIGLNWYLTPDKTHNSDGLHVNYLTQEEFRTCDEGLWLELGAIVAAGQREVRYMESDDLLESGLFPNATGLALKFQTTSQRYCMFIIQPQHRAGIEATVNQMLSTAWGEHFCLLERAAA